MSQNQEPDVECWLTAPPTHAATAEFTEVSTIIARIRKTIPEDHRSALHKLRHAEHKLLLYNAALTSRQRSYAWYWLGRYAARLTQWRSAYQALLRSSHAICTSDQIPWLLIQAHLGAAALQGGHFFQALSSFTSVIECLDQLFVPDTGFSYQQRAAMRHEALQGIACASSRLGITEPFTCANNMLPIAATFTVTWLADPTAVISES